MGGGAQRRRGLDLGRKWAGALGKGVGERRAGRGRSEGICGLGAESADGSPRCYIDKFSKLTRKKSQVIQHDGLALSRAAEALQIAAFLFVLPHTQGRRSC